MQIPLISIIIPTFNSGATLAIALESIVHQTFKNWELIIIDGGSADTTLVIAKEYQVIVPEAIKIHSEKDKGIYDAMNKAIDIAKGDWLYFMGSDDSLYETTTLEKISNLEALKNYEVVYGNVTSPRFNGVYAGEFTYSKLTNQNICHQAIFFNKAVFKKIGKFNLKYTAHADWDHNIRWFFSSKIKQIYSNLIIANYADGGFSSQGDAVFEKDKNSVFLNRGIGKLPVSLLINFCLKLVNIKNFSIYNFKWRNLYIMKQGTKLLRKLVK